MYKNITMTIYQKNKILSIIKVTNTGEILVTKFEKSIFHPFDKPKSFQKELESFLKTRIFDENRPDKKYILSTLNLINYDPLLIAQKTHGILFQDEIWLHFNNESFSWREAYAILQS